jgi:hypothetical protein
VAEQRIAEEQLKRQSDAEQAKERQRFLDLSVITRQLETDNKELKANFKELKRRLDDNKSVIRLTKEQLAEKQAECDRYVRFLNVYCICTFEFEEILT